MQLLIAETELPLEALSFRAHEYSILRSIVQTYLWHEPHLLTEMAAPTEEGLSPRLRRRLRRNLVSVLKKSIASGLIRREGGFFLLTSQGRSEMARRFELF